MPICDDLLVHLLSTAPSHEPTEKLDLATEPDELVLRRDVESMQKWIDLNA